MKRIGLVIIVSCLSLLLPATLMIIEKSDGSELTIAIDEIESITFSEGEMLVELIFVEGGTFNPTANYTVTLSSFYSAKYEVTQILYEEVMGYNPSHFEGIPESPVEQVSWFNAIEFCNRLSMMTGFTPSYSYQDDINHGTDPDDWPLGWDSDYDNHLNIICDWSGEGYRLLTEMEWEFAARGGVPAQNAGTINDSWAGTNEQSELTLYAWYFANSGGTTQQVGAKLPNELNLYDMSGNVWNYVWDIWGSSLPGGTAVDPTGPSDGQFRVFRGGSWFNYPSGCTVYNRFGSPATHLEINIGFRVGRNAP